jgi:flavin-binding protein dodecin
MNILMEDGQIRAYKVNLLVTFVLEDASYSTLQRR